MTAPASGDLRGVSLRPPELEAEYREHFLRPDARVAATVIGILTLAMMPFIVTDLRVAATSQGVALLFAGRAVLLLVGVAAVWGAMRAARPAALDAWVLAWVVAFSLTTVAFQSVRPSDYYLPITGDVLTAVVVWALLPNRFSLQAAGATIVTVDAIVWVLAFRAPPPPAVGLLIAVALLTANVVGAYVSLRSHRMRRRSFLEHRRAAAAEHEARHREARSRANFNSPAVGVVITSPEKGWIEVNDRACAMLGYSREELKRLTWLELTHPDDVAVDVAEFERVMAGEIDRYSLDKRFICKDGSTLWTLLSVSCVRRADRSIDYFVAILTDIGKRKRAEDDLRESEERHRTLVESLHAGVVVHAPDTSVILTNVTASELLGLSSEQMRGKVAIDPAWRFVRADGSTMPLQEYPINQVVATQHPVMNLTLGIDRPTTKDRVWVLVNAYPIFTSPGHLQQVVVTFVDITGEKKAEADRERLQTKLALASRLAAMGTLVAGVAHEINNPLAAQLSGQGIALELARDARMRRQLGTRLALETEIHLLDGVIEALEDAQEGGQRVARIVRDMAAFASPDPSRVRVRISDIVANAMRWVPASVAMVATVNVESQEAPDVVASAGQIEQVVVNLVTNAAKATPAGKHGDVIIRTSTGSHGMVRLEVIDHGTGIAPAIRGRIFEPFFTTRQVGEGKGTGLGLAVCHAIVTDHGGTITVESEVGKGSTFRVELPATPVEAQSPPIPGPSP